MVIEDLKNECKRLGIYLNSDIKHTRKDLITLIRNYHTSRGSSKSEKYLKHFYSPMLCYPFNSITKKNRENILRDENWIAEPKYYGSRIFITYFQTEGIKIYSRGLSDTSFMYEEITNKVCIDFPYLDSEVSFILDGMVIVDNVLSKGNLDPYLGMEDNAARYILSLSEKESISVQQKYAKMSIVALDMLMIGNKNTSLLSYYKRRNLLKNLLSGNIKNINADFNFIVPKCESKDKIGFFEHCVDNGYQGIILKNLNKPYDSVIRNKDTAIKVKKDYGSFTDDIDVFISGINRDGKVILSSYFLDNNGNEYEIEIGKSPLPNKYRTDNLVYSDFFGDFIIDPKIVGKVVVAKAAGFNKIKKQFNTLHIKWSHGFREDKHRLDCILTEDVVGTRFLKNVIS